MITITWSGLDEFVEDLREWKVSVCDFTEPLKQFGDYLTQESIPKQFEAQGTRYNGKWKPSKAAIKEGRATLIKDGTLMSSFTSVVSEKQLKIICIDDNPMRVFALNYGTKDGRLPPRPFIPSPLCDMDVQVLIDLLNQHMNDKSMRLGLI